MPIPNPPQPPAPVEYPAVPKLLQTTHLEPITDVEKAKPLSTPAATPQAPQPASIQTSSHSDMMAAAGIASSDYFYVDYIVSHESSWNYTAVNSEGSGATGLCQALPGWKMSSAGPDWATNPITQLRWCDSYAQASYGGWYRAYEFWTIHRAW